MTIWEIRGHRPEPGSTCTYCEERPAVMKQTIKEKDFIMLNPQTLIYRIFKPTPYVSYYCSTCSNKDTRPEKPKNLILRQPTKEMRINLRPGS